ncbi:MAG: hypothetical protein QGG40_01525 [Myxococcota bacterium]|nr:hypothetical protein [Myxococcota bacterium]
MRSNTGSQFMMFLAALGFSSTGWAQATDAVSQETSGSGDPSSKDERPQDPAERQTAESNETADEPAIPEPVRENDSAAVVPEPVAPATVPGVVQGAAEATPTTPGETRIGGKIFSHWGMDLSEGADRFNEFDIDRVYLTARRNLGQGLGVRVTTDVGRVEGEDTKLRPYLKYAYLETAQVVPGVTLRFGMVGNSLVGSYDQFWGHRYVRKSFADAHKIVSSADIGAYALGQHADGALSWQAALVNGHGYGYPETDVSKTAQLQVGCDLMSGRDTALPLEVYASTEVGTDSPETTVAASVGIDHQSVTARTDFTTQVAGAVSGMGYSAVLIPHLGEIANVILRYDHWDADTGVEDDANDTMVGGLAHDFDRKVSLALTYERTIIEVAPDAPSHGVFLRSQAAF